MAGSSPFPKPSIFSLLPALQTLCRLYGQAAGRSDLDGWSLVGRDPQVIEQLMPSLGWFYHYYYRVTTDGWDQIPRDQPVMLVGSHNGGIASPDMYMMMYDWFCTFGPHRPLFGLMTPTAWELLPPMAHLDAQLGAVRAHPKVAIAALKQGASIAVYPGGIQDMFRPYALRHQVCFQNRKAFIKLALKTSVPIVPMISYGAHATLRVLADFYPQLQWLHERGVPWPFGIDPQVFPIYLGLPWGIALGPLPNLPLPLALHTRIVRPIYFERTGNQAARDLDYVDFCYQQVQHHMQTALNALVAEHQPGNLPLQRSAPSRINNSN